MDPSSEILAKIWATPYPLTRVLCIEAQSILNSAEEGIGGCEKIKGDLYFRILWPNSLKSFEGGTRGAPSPPPVFIYGLMSAKNIFEKPISKLICFHSASFAFKVHFRRIDRLAFFVTKRNSSWVEDQRWSLKNKNLQT